MQWIFRAAACICICLVGISCAAHKPGPSSVSPQAQKMLARLKTQNHNLKTFKGMGKIILFKDGVRQISQLAWIGQSPEKLRASILSVSGQPIVSVAGDGQNFYVVSHAEKHLYKTPSKDPSLKDIIAIPIGLRAVVQLLGGRVPVVEYYSARVMPYENGNMLELWNWWGQLAERIWFVQNRVKKIAVFNREGKQVYEADLDKIKTIKSHPVPFSISVSDADSKFQLYIRQYWANTEIRSNAFVLKKPAQ